MNPILLCYLLLFVSVVTDTLRNVYNNHFGKNLLITTRDAMLFNVVCSAGASVFFVVLGSPLRISSYSMILALIFAAVTALAQYLSIMALATGPMSYSVLFTYLGMLIPTVYGIIDTHTAPSVCQYIGLALMIVTFFLCSDLKKDASVGGKWLFFAFGSFVGWGLVGVCQYVHQASPHAGEIKGFLLWTFLFTTVLFVVLYFLVPRDKEKKDGYRFLTRSTPLVLISGVIIGAVNFINLYLAGKLPPVIFYPIVNGGVIILAIVAAFVFYREKPDTKKLIGLVAGLAATILLGF